MNVRNIMVATAICISGVLAGSSVDASVSPSEDAMLEQVQSYLQSSSKTRSASYLQDVYASLEQQKKTTEHPYTRAQIRKIMQWMKQRYAFADTNAVVATNNKFIRSNGEIIQRSTSAGVTLTHEELIAKYGADAVTSSKKVTSSTKKPSVSSTPVIRAQEDTLFTTTSSYIDTIDTTATTSDDEWYTLKKGRINVTLLRASWLRWVNDFRDEEGVTSDIVHEPLMDKTATEWSYKMRSDGTWSHKRTPMSSYYDYEEIDQWFRDRGLAFDNVNGVTHTENVGQSSFYCDDTDCTDEAEQSLQYVFEYFINEKGQSYDAHYRTIIQPYFREMGFGIAVDEESGILYSTMHYATQAQRSPGRISAR